MTTCLIRNNFIVSAKSDFSRNKSAKRQGFSHIQPLHILANKTAGSLISFSNIPSSIKACTETTFSDELKRRKQHFF